MSNPLFYTEVKTINNDEYQIINVQSNETLFAKPIEKYFYFNDEISIYLKKILTDGNIITIYKSKLTEEKIGYVDFKDFSVKIENDLEQYKNKAKCKLNNIFTYYLASIGGLTFFKLIQSFSILAANEYYITNDNREQKYLEIVNTGDKLLILALEDYLDAHDMINPTSSMYISLKQCEMKLKKAKTKKEIDIICEIINI